ncbi:MAG: dihydroorotate dehydrogenase electron transfer subunit [Thermoproteota archaeon]|nr:dihydroorotate dehydrogenase electron transfer subunit [Thermoproteota archaeon]
MICKIETSKLRMVEIKEVKDETVGMKSFLFYDELCRVAKPGQFVMVWIPGVDEVPMSLSFIDDHLLSGISVENVGAATEALHSKVVGEVIGIRGPFGSYFSTIKGKVVLVGGGTGIAPLIPLAEALKKSGANVTFILGFKSSKELVFLDRVKALLTDKKDRLLVATEDGSCGEKCLATDLLEVLLGRENFEIVYTCGPELMMRKVFEVADRRSISVQVCLERIVRCGVGLCGSCVMGKFRVCKEGLVLSSEQIREVLEEFGKYKRDFDGRRIIFKSC